jgi:hypothetical protein
MKKLIALLLSVLMVLSMAACGEKNDDEKDGGKEETKVAVPESALEILEKTWEKFGEDEQFYVMGGDFDAPVDGAPGTVTNSEYMIYTLLVPEAEAEKVTDAAALIHGMMQNNFTCGVFRVEDAAAFAQTMKSAVENNQWMCGMPESMLIAIIGGEYVLMAYGINDALTPFKTHLTEVYTGNEIEIVADAAITG